MKLGEFERELRSLVRGDVRFDETARVLYSTDASIFEVRPLGVVTPRDADRVDQRTAATANRFGEAFAIGE